MTYFIQFSVRNTVIGIFEQFLCEKKIIELERNKKKFNFKVTFDFYWMQNSNITLFLPQFIHGHFSFFFFLLIIFYQLLLFLLFILPGIFPTNIDNNKIRCWTKYEISKRYWFHSSILAEFPENFLNSWKQDYLSF